MWRSLIYVDNEHYFRRNSVVDLFLEFEELPRQGLMNEWLEALVFTDPKRSWLADVVLLLTWPHQPPFVLLYHSH